MSSQGIGCGVRTKWPVLKHGETHVEHNWDLAQDAAPFQTPGTYRIHAKINLAKDIGWVDLPPVAVTIQEPLGWDREASKVLIAARLRWWELDWSSEPYWGKPEEREAAKHIVEEFRHTAYAPYAHYLLATYKVSSMYVSPADPRRWAQDDSEARKHLEEAIDLLKGLYGENIPEWLQWRAEVGLARCRVRAGRYELARSMLKHLEESFDGRSVRNALRLARHEVDWLDPLSGR